MVTIPQGNYDNQKIIIGKQVTNDNTPMVYKSPLQNMINLTNNIIPDNSNLRVEMWANHPDDYAWPDDVLFSESSVYTTTIAGNNPKLKYCIWDSNDTNMQCFYQKYDILGLSAQFSTWLNEYNTISGNYGLMLEITFKDLNAEENFSKAYSCQLDSNDFFGDVYNFETYYTQEKTFDLSDYKDSVITRLRLFAYQRCNFVTLDEEYVPYADPDEFSDIPPNIYMKDFMIALGTYNNEISEDIVEIMTDSSMTYDKNPELNFDPEWIASYILSHPEELKEKIETYWRYIPEIDAKETEEEKLEYKDEAIKIASQRAYDKYQKFLVFYNSGTISKDDSFDELRSILTYEIQPNHGNTNFINNIRDKKDRTINNLKYINLRWVHIFDENNIKVVQENEIPKNYEIRWYRYLPGAPSPDQFAGAHWVYLTDQPAAAGASVEVMLNKINVEFQPDVNKNEEKIKVIIIKKENDKEYKVAVSNILEFNNNTEIRNTVTLKDAQALYLKINDNFNGNYLIYNRSGSLGKTEFNTEYSVSAMFNPELEGNGNLLSAEDCDEIIWYLPKNNTMIKPKTDAIGYIEEENYYLYSSNKTITIINEQGQEQEIPVDKNGLITVSYYIKEKLNYNDTNNTIRLDIIKDGLQYSAATKLLFGTSGNNGSDYTIQVEWNKNAIDVDPSPDIYGEQYKDTLIGELTLLDKNQIPVDLSNSEISVEWKTAINWDELQKENSTTNYVFETDDNENIYYPVLLRFGGGTRENEDQWSAGNNCVWMLSNFINGYSQRQPNGLNSYDSDFKYFLIDDNAQDYLNENREYYYYDLNEKKFIEWEKRPITENGSSVINNTIAKASFPTNGSNFIGPLYRKKLPNEIKYKITFKEIKLKKYISNDPEEIETIVGRRGHAAYNTFDQTNEDGQFAYYNFYRKYFIYRDGQYILDPWEDFNEYETYYEPILQPPIIRDDLNISNNDKLNCECITEYNNTLLKNPQIRISYNNTFSKLNHIYILKITIKKFGDYPLISYEPIALTRSKNVVENEEPLYINYINGPREVRYSTTGEVDFDQSPFEIQGMILTENGFGPISHNYSKKIDLNNNLIEEESLLGNWRLLIGDKNSVVKPNEKSNQFNPSLEENALEEYQVSQNEWQTKIIAQQTRNVNGITKWLVYHSPTLHPPAVYYEKAAPYAIQFLQPNNTVLWTQPILVWQDNYPSSTLNSWNGKDIVTDEETGTITANGFAAGHKNDDNTFSGVVLGDWSRTDIDPSITNPPGSTYAEPMTGVYGFNHGAMSYALKDDGTAFFGKDGRGRIYFDGNNALIHSSSWKFRNPEGMMLDLDDGILDTIGTQTVNNETFKGEVYISPKVNNLIDIKVNEKKLLHVGQDGYYLQTYDYNDDPNNPEKGTQINLGTGNITSYNFSINAKATYDNESGAQRGISLSSSPYLQLRYDKIDDTKNPPEAKEHYLMRFTSYYQFLQSKDFDNTAGKEAGTKIDLKTGTITSFNFKLNALQSYNENAPSALRGIYLTTEGPKFQIRSDQIDENNNVTPHYLVNIDNGSNFYLQSKNFNNTSNGTKIDLAQGRITSYNLQLTGYKTIDNDLKAIKINSTASNHPIVIGSDNNSNWNFKVSWDGALKLKGSKTNAGTITLDSSGDSNTNPLMIKKDNNHQFYVDWDGIMHATGASVSGTITGSEIYLPGPADNTNNKFWVTSDGTMHAKKGEIGGWDITGNSIEKSEISMGSGTYKAILRGDYDSYYEDAFGIYKKNSQGAYASILRILWDGTIIHGSEKNGSTPNFKLDGSTGNINATGVITATSGQIGGWNINLFDSDHDYGSLYRSQSAGADNGNTGEVQFGGKNFAIYVNNGKFSVRYNGDMVAQNGTFTGQISNGNFTVTKEGAVTASNINITGGSINIKKNNNTVFSASSDGVEVHGSIHASSYYMGSYSSSFNPQTLDVITEIGMANDGTVRYIKAATISFISLTTVATSEVYRKGGGCFIAGTKISMANGKFKTIENIKKNDLIIAYNENNNNFVIGKVVKTKKNNISTKMMEIILSNNIKINMTISHPILTISGWKAIDCDMAFLEHGVVCGKLSEKDQIITQNGIFNIKSITEYDYNLPVYNFIVDKYHTYIADTCVVHNSFVVNETK